MRTLALILILLVQPFMTKEKTLGTYEVVNGQIESSQGKGLLAIEYLGEIKRIIPSGILKRHLGGIELFTDGRGGLAESVEAMDDHNEGWLLRIDIEDFRLDGDSINKLRNGFSLIHEFAHILTLNSTQVKYTEDEYERLSKGYLTTEGYAIPKSYLCQFVRKFWNEEVLYESFIIDGIRSDNRRQRKQLQQYLKMPDQYVSDYAATNPEEDIADSWAFFVLGERSTGTAIHDQKVNFFYTFPELVELRTQIRANLDFPAGAYLESYEAEIAEDLEFWGVGE